MSAQDEKRPGIHVVGVDVENMHRLRVARVRLLAGGGLVRVTGRNGQGKTSFLNTIREALGGAGEVTVLPIHDGADAGHVRLELSNGWTITRRVTETNPKGYLTVIAPDGGKHGQGKLGEWLGPNSFDPLSFFSLKGERQREILLDLSPDRDLRDKLEEIRKRHAELYAERTPHISEKQRCGRIKRPDGERPQAVDVSAMMARLAELQATQRDAGDRARDLAERRDEIQREGDACDLAEQRVAELRKKLADAEEALADQRATLRRLDVEFQDAREAHDAVPPVDDELAVVTARLSEADTVNASLEPWREWERAQESLAVATMHAAELTSRIDATKVEEMELLANAGLPVDGLSFDAETREPLLGGFPLALASGAERIALSVAVALAVNPELRICLVDEANDLDLDALTQLDELAKLHGFQVFACRIGLEGAGDIIVEDGQAVTPAEAGSVG